MTKKLSPKTMSHSFTGEKEGNSVRINGSYDVNVWYSFDHDSKTEVANQTYSYTDIMNVPLKEETKLTDNSEIIVRCLRQPTVSNVEIKNGLIDLSIEKELGVEIVGEAKVKINVEEDEDEYEEIFDEITDSEIESIDVDYLEKSDS